MRIDTFPFTDTSPTSPTVGERRAWNAALDLAIQTAEGLAKWRASIGHNEVAETLRHFAADLRGKKIKEGE